MLLLVAAVPAIALLWLRDLLVGPAKRTDAGPSRCKGCNYLVAGLFAKPIVAYGELSAEVLAQLRGSVQCPECGERLTVESTVIEGYARGAGPDPLVRSRAQAGLTVTAGIGLFFAVPLPLLDTVVGHARAVKMSSSIPVSSGNVTRVEIVSTAKARAHLAADTGRRRYYRFERPGVEARVVLRLSDGRKAVMRMPFVALGDRGWLHAKFIEPDGDVVATTDMPVQADVDAWLDRSGIVQRSEFADKVLPAAMASLGNLSSSKRVHFSLVGPGMPTWFAFVLWIAPFAWGGWKLVERGKRLAKEQGADVLHRTPLVAADFDGIGARGVDESYAERGG